MSRYVIYETERPWPLMLRVAQFPYVVYDETSGTWPMGRLVAVANTLRGARRHIRKDAESPYADPGKRVAVINL